eukprot:TRINITY_DN3871_c0_g2_i1.p1 TRINITY_DN3871_c0_g2~~TRINITY_DN3871_c0_g2_i1.p1  ORF type:complete len:338 (-),score=70.85 TRINITY_DN3871_c0_g2_i1:886-1899(-)
MGNVVLWKPSEWTAFSNYKLMELFEEAGLPPGVINFIPGPAKEISDVIFRHPSFAGVHYTGSTQVFKTIWKQIGQNVDSYKSYPRIVGETGGKDFIFAHRSVKDVDGLATALIRGAFEYAGQKCSAASRAYIPASLWPTLKKKMLEDLASVKVGSPEDPTNFVNAVIHKNSFQKLKFYLHLARQGPETEIISGGGCDDSVGYFVEPTVVVTKNPHHKFMTEEIFGPVLTIFVYEDADFEQTLRLCDKSDYALTGSIFASDPYAIEEAQILLMFSAGNLYINDKPTGAVVGQQPFAGSRLSGTNDKAGSYLNLLRWTSPLTVKTTHVPASHYSYPNMK